VSSVNGQSGNVVVDFVGDTKVSMRTANHGAWLLCNGQAVSRTIYSALFAVLGTTWGSGDGSTTFNLPNPAGRAIGIAGAGSGLTSRAIGTQIGTESHILSTAEMPSHSHSVQGYVRSDYDANDSFSNFNGLDTGGNNYNTTSVGGGGAHNNMQPTSFIGNLFVYSGVV
jgi:microcystin-dependent protein